MGTEDSMKVDVVGVEEEENEGVQENKLSPEIELKIGDANLHYSKGCYDKLKKRGRRKGSKNKVSPEIEGMIGVANLHYSQGCYDKVIPVLHEVIRLAPNLSVPYHTLGLVHDALGDYKKALNFYMFAAHLKPKDPTLWKTILTWSMEHGNSGHTNYCLSKAIAAEPTNITLRSYHALFHKELGDYQKAAESYEQIYRLIPENIAAVIESAKLYQECGQLEHSIHLLEDYVKTHPSDADLSVIDLLAAIFMKSNAHDKALQIIEHANLAYCSEKELPLNLTIKEGICRAHLKSMEKAEKQPR